MPVAIGRVREIVTLDPTWPVAEAAAMRGERILLVGSCEEIVDALGDDGFITNDTDSNDIIVPGFLESRSDFRVDGALGQVVWAVHDDRRRLDPQRGHRVRGLCARGCTSPNVTIVSFREPRK